MPFSKASSTLGSSLVCCFILTERIVGGGGIQLSVTIPEYLMISQFLLSFLSTVNEFPFFYSQKLGAIKGGLFSRVSWPNSLLEGNFP